MLCPKGMCIIHDVLTLMTGCASECVLVATRNTGLCVPSFQAVNGTISGFNYQATDNRRKSVKT